MDRWDLINYLIETFGYKTYLEIGVYDPKNNFDKIKAEVKHGVDPDPAGPVSHKMKADDFFAQNKDKYDLIFIDGFHVDEQVCKDVANSLASLTPNGMIVLHDCNPLEKDHQEVPAVTTYWVGTVWKAFTRFLTQLPPDIEMFVVDIDTGIGIMKATGKGTRLDPIPEQELTFENLELNRASWLNLKTFDEFLAWVKAQVPTPTPKKSTKAVTESETQSMKLDQKEANAQTLIEPEVETDKLSKSKGGIN